MLNIHYLANTGILVECDGKKILIDGIHTKEVNPYDTLDDETLRKVINGEPPFDGLNLLLFTHYHWDHLDGKMSIEALKSVPNLKLFSSKQTVDFIRTMPNYDVSIETQLIHGDVPLKCVKDFTINGVEFSVASLLHDGEEFKDVVNFTYILKFCEETVFHCGDAKPNEYNFENLNLDKYNITTALLDFPYITLSSGRKVIKSFIKPENIVVMHLPNRNKDTYNWLKTIHKVVDRYSDSMPKMLLCENPNTSYIL